MNANASRQLHERVALGEAAILVADEVEPLDSGRAGTLVQQNRTRTVQCISVRIVLSPSSAVVRISLIYAILFLFHWSPFVSRIVFSQPRR